MDLGFGLVGAAMAGRIAEVALGVLVLVGTLVAAARFYSSSFFHGFMVSSGIFLSFDIVVFHWIFKLHRITSGPEADIIEPLFVLTGLGFIAYGLINEKRRSPKAEPSSR